MMHGRKNIKKIKCVFWYSLQNLSETFFIIRRTERDMIKMHIGLLVKCQFCLSDCNGTWILCTDFRKIL